MSWQQYVDKNLVGTGMVKHAGIYGHNGAKWAASPGFNVTAAEIVKIVANIKQTEAQELYTSGVHIAGTKYMYLRHEPNLHIYCRKGQTGLCISLCKQCVLVGFFDDTMQPGRCNTVVEKLAEYLIGQNY